MRTLLSGFGGLSTVVAMLFAACNAIADDSAAKSDVPAALDFEMKNLGGQETKLSKYEGKVVLIVNVASKCGFTPQYEQLQALYKQYGKDGLAILAFPCNQFGQQEPGSAKEIREFCTTNYGVEFDMFSKVDVNGDSACDLYKYLTKLDVKPKGLARSPGILRSSCSTATAR